MPFCALPRATYCQHRQYITKNKMGVARRSFAGSYLPPPLSPLPLPPLRVTKANYAIVCTARGRISRTPNCECQILHDRKKKNFQSEIVANPEPIFPRDIVRKSRETNALTTAAATKTFTDTQEFIVAYLDFAFANARTRFSNGKGH